MKLISTILLLALISCDKKLDSDLLPKAVNACGGFKNVRIYNSYYEGYLYCQDGTTRYIGTQN